MSKHFFSLADSYHFFLSVGSHPCSGTHHRPSALKSCFARDPFRGIVGREAAIGYNAPDFWRQRAPFHGALGEKSWMRPRDADPSKPSLCLPIKTLIYSSPSFSFSIKRKQDHVESQHWIFITNTMKMSVAHRKQRHKSTSRLTSGRTRNSTRSHQQHGLSSGISSNVITAMDGEAEGSINHDAYINNFHDTADVRSIGPTYTQGGVDPMGISTSSAGVHSTGSSSNANYSSNAYINHVSSSTASHRDVATGEAVSYDPHLLNISPNYSETLPPYSTSTMGINDEQRISRYPAFADSCSNNTVASNGPNPYVQPVLFGQRTNLNHASYGASMTPSPLDLEVPENNNGEMVAAFDQDNDPYLPQDRHQRGTGDTNYSLPARRRWSLHNNQGSVADLPAQVMQEHTGRQYEEEQNRFNDGPEVIIMNDYINADEPWSPINNRGYEAQGQPGHNNLENNDLQGGRWT
ncbi:hypothetical protein F4804DRAFT_310811 [Jackrogersella minutella]|nr:hypothetical protein F4804DRAFT_310811 [Jackrogersella minutella]